MKKRRKRREVRKEIVRLSVNNQHVHLCFNVLPGLSPSLRRPELERVCNPVLLFLTSQCRQFVSEAKAQQESKLICVFSDSPGGRDWVVYWTSKGSSL